MATNGTTPPIPGTVERSVTDPNAPWMPRPAPAAPPDTWLQLTLTGGTKMELRLWGELTSGSNQQLCQLLELLVVQEANRASS